MGQIVYRYRLCPSSDLCLLLLTWRSASALMISDLVVTWLPVPSSSWLYIQVAWALSLSSEATKGTRVLALAAFLWSFIGLGYQLQRLRVAGPCGSSSTNHVSSAKPPKRWKRAVRLTYIACQASADTAKAWQDMEQHAKPLQILPTWQGVIRYRIACQA